MSKRVLKRDWKNFDPAQQQQFVTEFRETLSARYGEDLGRYGKFDGTPVDYRLRDGSGWQVIDVVIENVSLVSSFRTQFAEVLSKSGPTGVLKKLEERNAARAAAKGKD